MNWISGGGKAYSAASAAKAGTQRAKELRYSAFAALERESCYALAATASR